MATYKMKSTQKGVRAGEVHPREFLKDKTYEIDDNLAEQFKTLDAVEESSEEAIQPDFVDDRDDLHENWLDKDPAVLRHGELTAAQVIAKDESPLPDPAAVNQIPSKAEGDEPAAKADDAKADPKTDADDAKSKKSK